MQIVPLFTPDPLAPEGGVGCAFCVALRGLWAMASAQSAAAANPKSKAIRRVLLSIRKF